MPFSDALRQVVRDVSSAQELAGAIETGLLLILIAVAAWAALRVGAGLVRRAVQGPRRPGHTFAPIFEGLVRYAIIFAALVLMLETVHVNVTALLASAGVIGVALGFGAQYLIRDVLAGFFLISEDIIRVGDIVRFDADTGTVVRVSLRITQIRKSNGELLTIPNGQIGRIGNLTRDYGTAIVQVTIPYRADVAAALEALRDAGREWAAADTREAQGQPVVDGTVDLKETGATLQLSVRVRPGRQWAVEADLRQRALKALAERGIKIDTRISATM